MTVQPVLPAGQEPMLAVPGSGVVVDSGLVVASGSGVSCPLASGSAGSGVSVAPSGVAEGAGAGVGATSAVAGGVVPTWSVSSASWMIAIATAIAASTASAPTSTIGVRQPGAATIRVPTAAPQDRHHSCCSVIGAPQRGHWRPVGCCSGGGVSTVVTSGPG